jgi:hypothetical protein
MPSSEASVSVSHAYPPQAHQIAASTSIPWPSPSQVGFSDISPVTWVNANTNTRSKKSSSGVTRGSFASSRSASVTSGVVVVASIG